MTAGPAVYTMRIRDVQWPPGIKAKVERKHGLSQEEVETAAFDKRSWIKRAGPDRYILLGRASNGAYVSMIYSYSKGVSRVITARRMDWRERRIYQRSGK